MACRLSSVAALLLVAGVVSACRRGGGCEAAEGIALVFEPTRGNATDAEGVRSQIEGISRTQLVVAHDEVVVFIASQEEKAFSDAKNKVVQQTRSLGLELTVEDMATIDGACTVRLKHRESPIRRLEPARP